MFFQNKWGPQDCTAIVPAIEVMTVARNLSTFTTVRQLIFTIEILFYNLIGCALKGAQWDAQAAFIGVLGLRGITDIRINGTLLVSYR